MNRRPITVLGFVLLAVAGFTLWAVADEGVVIIRDALPSSSKLQDKVAESETELADLRRKIRSYRKKVKALDSERSTAKKGHEDLEQEIALTRKFLLELDERENLLSRHSHQLEKGIAANQATFIESQRALARSLRAMYIRQQPSELESILTAESFSEFVARARFNGILARLGGGLVDEARQQSNHIDQEGKALAHALAEIWENREEAKWEEGRLELLVAEQVAALRDLENDRKYLKRKLSDLRLSEKRLAYVLSDLEQQRREKVAEPEAVSDQSALSGTISKNLDWPVQGTILRGFGQSVHPRFKTITLNNGINIAAPEGTTVSAVMAGTVEFTDHLPGFGQCVILDHGAGYYTLYAHLDHVFVPAAEKIAAGQVIAEVGRPSAEDQPQLYFEIRQGKTPLDPTDWLKSR
jgi:murein hydrolase activator